MKERSSGDDEDETAGDEDGHGTQRSDRQVLAQRGQPNSGALIKTNRILNTLKSEDLNCYWKKFLLVVAFRKLVIKSNS